ncbi:MAG: hypothetical protein A2451_04495 [Bdellovibrionales bacterium RIFOXYC2_FULL_39_8]|nr:MAG: hypothetical protein A2451_04495 [Bdellovibrionales bacterium RIFOXYC2_FULL_39_8]
MSNIKVKRYFTEREIKDKSRLDYFPEDNNEILFYFESGEVAFVLGKKLDFDQTFYMEIQSRDRRQWAVAYDSSENSGPYNAEEESNNPGRYNRIKHVLNLDEGFFYDTHIFRSKLGKKIADVWSEVKLSLIDGKSFSINFNNRTTNPPVYAGIGYLGPYFTELSQKFLALKGTSMVLDFQPVELAEELASLQFKDLKGVEEELKLYTRYMKRSGLFVRAMFSNNLYEVDRPVADLFLIKVQDLWDKRLFSLNSDIGKQNIFFEINFEDHAPAQLKIPFSETLTVNRIDPGPPPKVENFKKLFRFLTLSMADSVTFFDKTADTTTAEAMLEKTQFKMKFEDFDVALIFDKGEIIIINEKYNIQLHYIVGERDIIKFAYDDYFF